MSSLVIAVSPEGQVQAVHTDRFDLGFLGPKKVYRQSDIRFSEDTQTWYIVYLDGAIEYHENWLYNFSGYEEARQCEVAWLNGCRALGVDPVSPQGGDIMRQIRTSLVQ